MARVAGCECDKNPDARDWVGCINGVWYGPCESEFCGGMCEWLGRCDCECHLRPESEG